MAALAAFRHEVRRYLAFAQKAAEAKGLTPQQHQAMLAVRASPSGALNVSELANALFLRHHSAVELTNRLESARLAARAPDPSDKRRTLVRLTARGERVLNSLASAHLSELREHGPELARALRDVLAKRARESG